MYEGIVENVYTFGGLSGEMDEVFRFDRPIYFDK
jgi:hypothetical protein